MTRAEFMALGLTEVKPGVFVPSTAKGMSNGALPVVKPIHKRMGHIHDLPLKKITLILKGEPMPKQSVRSYANGSFKVVAGGKKVYNVFHYQPPEMDERKLNYQKQVMMQLPPDFKMFSQRVHIRKMHFIFPPLKGFSKVVMEKLNAGEIVYKETKPDADNLQKMLYDSLNKMVFSDDSIIVSVDDVKKCYGLGGLIILELEGI